MYCCQLVSMGRLFGGKKMAKLNKNWKRMDEKLDDEISYMEAKKIHETILAQRELIQAKMEKLQAEMDELNTLDWNYDGIETGAAEVEQRTKKWLEYMGYPLNSSRKMTEKAYREYQELECYIGKTHQVYPGLDGKVAEIVEVTYKGDGKGGMLRDERGNPIQLSVLEDCEYYPEYRYKP